MCYTRSRYKRIDRRLLCSGEGAVAVLAERPATDALSDSQHAVHLVRQDVAAIGGLWPHPVNETERGRETQRETERETEREKERPGPSQSMEFSIDSSPRGATSACIAW